MEKSSGAVLSAEIKNAETQDKIFSIIFKEDELTWQNIIFDLVRTENMNPWDIDVSLLAQKFLEMLMKLKEMDFRISGKVVLASAVLLKLKSTRLVGEDINALDELMAGADTPEVLDELNLDEGDGFSRIPKDQRPRLSPKTPQPRKRKVSIYDLVEALEKALEVEVRRPEPIDNSPKFKMPDRRIDVSQIIHEVYQKIETHYQGKEESSVKRLTFSELIPSNTKDDKVYTFIPLLQLENQKKVNMFQEVHFGEIEIELLKNSNPIIIEPDPAVEGASPAAAEAVPKQ